VLLRLNRHIVRTRKLRNTYMYFMESLLKTATTKITLKWVKRKQFVRTGIG
jgi:hypothetical protein